MKVAQIKENDLGNYLTVSKKDDVPEQSLLDRDDLNRLRKLNYADYYVKPSQFNDKIKKLDSELKQSDVKFTRLDIRTKSTNLDLII